VAWPIKSHELPDWIERRLRARGLRADRDAVQLLADRVEGNLLAAAQEIDTLALLADGGTLDLARMQALVADAARYDVFRLTDAALNGQPAQV
ncbi:DNA polymerase III subunit delta, partial [Salmonella sp. s55004]|uniref:DNA polymerase III subunit delta n=1 Tax=Salmonella sp. s55004 TaxID=3159675 RepID=UPI003981183B